MKDVGGGVVDVGGHVADKVWPGDSIPARIVAMGIPGFPGDSIPEKIESVGLAPVRAAHVVSDQIGRRMLPGYATASDAGKKIDKTVKGNVPGGWRTVGLGGLVLVLLVLWKLLLPTAVEAGKTAAKSYVPVPSPPKQKPRSTVSQPRRRVPPPARGPRPTWNHSGRAGKADVIAASQGRVEVCADTEAAAMSAARKRFQGWQVQNSDSTFCDLNPDKMHISATKVRR